MRSGYLNEMCDECAEAAMLGMKTSCCGDEMSEPVETCDMCGMPMQDNLCDCCEEKLHGYGSSDHIDHSGHEHDHFVQQPNVKIHSMKESYSFDKFMDNILLKENRKVQTGDSAMRKRAERHQERPMNRIVFGVNKL